jgi:branched-chain amino acid transport system permease protein
LAVGVGVFHGFGIAQWPSVRLALTGNAQVVGDAGGAFVTILLSGLSIGGLYALTAVGFNIVFVTSGLFNFAQAQFMMVGTFIAYWTASQLHLPVAWSILIGLGIGAVLGLVVERIAIRPIQRFGPQNALVTTIGVGVILDGVASVVWGTQPLNVPFFGSSKPFHFLGGAVVADQLLILGAAAVICVGMEALSRTTLIGLASMATAEDREAAMVRGINVRRFSMFAVAGAAAFAGCLGSVIGPQTYALFDIGDTLAVTAFVVMAVGGFGSYVGALIAGFVVGVVEQESVRYFSAVYQDIFVFALLVTVLMIRPAGLFRSHIKRTV